MIRNPEIRRDKLLKLLRSKRLHKIDEVMKEAEASQATVHRDLDVLEGRGLIRKSYGCVEALDSRTIFLDYDKRLSQNFDLKRAIAREAAAVVEPGDTIFIDASSTCYHLLTFLSDMKIEGLTIISNSAPAISLCTGGTGGFKLITIGGVLDVAINAFCGPLAAEMVSQMSFKKAFVSGAGFSLRAGLTTTRQDILETVRKALDGAERRYCLVDSTKYRRDCLLRIADLRQFEQVIADDGLAPDESATLRDSGVSLKLASMGAKGNG